MSRKWKKASDFRLPESSSSSSSSSSMTSFLSPPQASLSVGLGTSQVEFLPSVQFQRQPQGGEVSPMGFRGGEFVDESRRLESQAPSSKIPSS